ncbi:tyrosine-type recombinase/integrase [Bradyrhizobium sp. KB893862 SZCCT0404]|uniref:tyrosine-type recombinase/integrase n=1 Tax=Bradyrhizobium sp. KB893862 SZCCT0404 TaxID=2807672 RepID=UPI001BA6118A|nr:tyrosine-type recombinase/integrase [Bradyrhizobium sp. KB893862 SZCCT0404]MBR1173874.1 tyrosine-type recombinase/integrase [Bradyrhizobium sp. KB893862 SZCCT0404]
MSYAETRKGKKTGIWIGERTIDGRKRRCRATTKKAADAWEAYVDRFGCEPTDGTGSANPHTLGALKVRARAERPDWKDSRDPSLDQRLEVVMEFFGATSTLEAITNDKLTEFVRALEARGGRYGGSLSGKTVNRYLSVVSALLDHGRFLGWTMNTPAFPWQNETKGRMLYFKDWQDAPMLAALAERPLQVCYEVFAAAALRPTEFFSLTEQQVDVRNDWAWLRLWKTKNDEARSIPVDIELGKELLMLIKTGALPSHDDFYKAIKAACASLGYDKGFNVYSMRHTGCTRAARRNAGAKVQKFAGHKDYRTTQNYIHLEDEDMADVAATMRSSR